jgi:hypothetical protein
MPVLNETARPGECLISEANGERSRDTVTIGANQTLVAGQVVARVTATGHIVAVAPAASDGSQTAIGVLWAAVTTTAATKRGVLIARDAEVARSKLSFAALTSPQQTTAITQLASVGIIVR